ncbi:hypothetical protein BFW38_03675 [Terasakiispira papahanaumokuakeensis]|uniref:ABC-type transport auxiliary lipoprotein component domain-containing protein n=1 Tax=Terasakiispira papahanaumokuakeensis TaxID=197479 RepID=A0A1E2V7G3_9GAMM|nr:YajG family lipoprotein [Terasakiispira papahanaumokuakeensis]ODC02776.1 hypothetical protein BFW38_03675 [Terasakiispira papahanaumokuakeensis]
MTQKLKLMSLVLTLLIMQGCSTHYMPIAYTPETPPPMHSSLTQVKIVSVVDNRDTDNHWLGAIRGGFGNPVQWLYTEEETVKTVQNAFLEALEKRNLLAQGIRSDYRLDVELTKFDVSQYVNKEAHAHLTLSLVQEATGNQIFSKAYRTDNEEETLDPFEAGILGNPNILQRMANEVLSQTIDKSLDDPAFISALKATYTPPQSY